jgi:hypothetical protein
MKDLVGNDRRFYRCNQTTRIVLRVDQPEPTDRSESDQPSENFPPTPPPEIMDVSDILAAQAEKQ